MTGSAKTLHACVFYTSSQKQLWSPGSSTDFLPKYCILGNFRGKKFLRFCNLKFFANKFSRIAIKARSDHMHAFKFLRLQEKSVKTYESECFITYIALDIFM